MKSSVEMAPQYDAKAAEAWWAKEWVERGYFHAEPSGREPYCIVLPPPNVTGALHAGHAFQQSLQDFLVRRKRMQGFETLWLPGTDHAGIATQVVVERELRKEGIDRREMGREAFLERVWAWKERFGGRIVEQMQALGNSCDWDRLRFTMDEGLSRAVRVAFVRMYDDGLIYRGERIINWCPTDHTALSDSEVEHEEVDGELVTFRYALSEGGGHVDVATTRVETMLGDTGVAVHPEDRRYTELVGRTVRHPFTERDLPIVADGAVDPAFGTGAVKVTPAHDPTDFEIAERTGLPRINILTPDATLADTVPERFRGLDRHEARREVLEALRDLGLVVAEERPYVHAVGHCYRCRTEIEPWLSGKQWFVAVDRLKEPAAQAARDGRITFWPERWINPYLDWMDNLRDWNISRQLWWGHRIPVWYCPEGHEFAAVEDPKACRECGSEDIEQDPDVLDTWFSSQLWPFSTLGWPDETEDLRFFYPTTVLVTGYEILYLWVARMIMSGLYLMGDVPFRDVVIHGLVRDKVGRKMSKSLGNVIDPLDMIERYGADALRFALARMASPEQQNLPLSEEAIELGRNFANKIWNAARLILSSTVDGPPPTEVPAPDGLTLVERWVLSRHELCRREVDDALDAYRFDEAAQTLQRFLWHELADWGLELSKEAMRSGRPETTAVLRWVLDRTLRLLHPILPFVTEEVWQRLELDGSITIAAWPDRHPEHEDPDGDEAFGAIQSLVREVRNRRPLLELSQGYQLVVDESLREHAEPLAPAIERMTGSALMFSAEPRVAGRSLRISVGAVRAAIEVPESFDPEPARAARRKRLQEAEAKLAQSERKLGNEQFLTKAKPEAIDRERHNQAELQRQLLHLREELEQLDRIEEGG
ncbi:MAG: valine--tRNA ligase [Actinomycetota bacterium]